MLAGGGTIAPAPGALPPWKGFVAIFPALYAAAEKHQKEEMIKQLTFKGSGINFKAPVNCKATSENVI